jgi:hypothetical protein
MNRRVWAVPVAVLFGVWVVSAAEGLSQPPGGKDDKGKGKGGFGGPPGGSTQKLVKEFDKNNDGWLNAEERAAAREVAKKGGGKGGFGGKGFGGGKAAPQPGPKVAPADVTAVTKGGLYEPSALRTIFLDFENKDWEAELQDFRNTDVDVPATATVDGKQYKNVGVHFRGMSSYFGVGAGFKRSLNLSFDLADEKQRLMGYKTLNLLNANTDPTFMSTVLYSHIAGPHLPTPKANLVRVVINGESWGVYTNVQQFDKVFLQDNYKTAKGTRWKIRGSPGGRGGLEYFGDDPEQYKRVFEIKSKDDPEAWKKLVNLCKVLNQTPPDKLEAALTPILDIDSVLWFLALDVALINSDGYWTRASDYSIYLDEKDKFHVVPHDMNESFRPGFGGGPGGPGGGMMFRMPPPGEVLPLPLQDALGLTAEQKKQLDEIQKDVNAKLGKILNDEQNKQFRRLKYTGVGGAVAVPAGGPPGGGMGPGGGGGVTLDPLVGLDDARKPLRSKLLAVPSLKAKYLVNVRQIAEESLDWKNLGPVVAQYRKLIDKEIEADTRKLASYEAFKAATADEVSGGPGGGRGGGFPLRAFADQRRKYLLDHPEIKKLGK